MPHKLQNTTYLYCMNNFNICYINRLQFSYANLFYLKHFNNF